MDDDLPHHDSTIIERLVISDPAEDQASSDARVAESRPNPISPSITVVPNDSAEAPRSATRSRHEGGKRKEMKFGEYILGQTLGEGEFGKVKMGWKRDGSAQVAIKLIRKESLDNNPTRLPKIHREIAILKELDHPNIVRLHEMYETERHIGIILEYASGGELFDYILQHRYLKDNAARRLFAQLISGVGYLHKKGIVHRDLKLENLLLDRNRNIIITDFGFANTFNPDDELGEEAEFRLQDKEFVKRMGLDEVGNDGHRRGDLMQTSCGSPCYAAPELVVSDSLYTGRKVDVWSCGVILVSCLILAIGPADSVVRDAGGIPAVR
jgi:protein-serine/threonine kinase